MATGNKKPLSNLLAVAIQPKGAVLSMIVGRCFRAVNAGVGS
jgi:hypothetical protein